MGAVLRNLTALLEEPVQSLKIAIVDDDRELLNLYSKELDMLGYPSPLVFPDGTSLVRALMNDQESLDVILMDYRLPEMNGIQAAEIIMRYRKEIAIVIMSAYDFVRQRADNIGLPFLQKPFSMEQLARCLEGVKPKNSESSDRK